MLNEAAHDKIRKYRVDYNNDPPNSVVFMPTIPGTNGRLHSDFIRLNQTWELHTSTFDARRS